jgi:aspartate aminotransferase
MVQISDCVMRLAESATFAMMQKSNELSAQGVNVINMSVGEPDFNTPDHVKRAAIEAVEQNYSKYSPVPGYMWLRKSCSDKLKRENNLDYKPSQIIISTGAKQSLCNAVMAIVNPGDEVLLPSPCWVSYPEMVRLPYMNSCISEIKNFSKIATNAVKIPTTRLSSSMNCFSLI